VKQICFKSEVKTSDLKQICFTILSSIVFLVTFIDCLHGFRSRTRWALAWPLAFVCISFYIFYFCLHVLV